MAVLQVLLYLLNVLSTVVGDCSDCSVIAVICTYRPEVVANSGANAAPPSNADASLCYQSPEGSKTVAASVVHFHTQ
jgi:hypothetical protein